MSAGLTGRVGTVIADRYRIDGLLGRGGMGAVYRAEHTWTDRPVAVKVLLPELAANKTSLKRFFAEAKTAGALNHPNVVDVLDMGVDDEGLAFLVLELLEGRSLAEHLTEMGRLDIEHTLTILVPVMDALAAAHDRAVIHRDIKPDNIFLSVDGTGRLVPKLLDFGIAKLKERVQTQDTMGIVGTPYFMSPEHASPDVEILPASDVWSMGVVFYQCLTGVMPIKVEGIPKILMTILTRDLPSIATEAPELPAAFVEAIDRSMKRDLSERHASMDAFLEALRIAAEEHSVEVEWPDRERDDLMEISSPHRRGYRISGGQVVRSVSGDEATVPAFQPETDGGAPTVPAIEEAATTDDEADPVEAAPPTEPEPSPSVEDESLSLPVETRRPRIVLGLVGGLLVLSLALFASQALREDPAPTRAGDETPIAVPGSGADDPGDDDGSPAPPETTHRARGVDPPPTTAPPVTAPSVTAPPTTAPSVTAPPTTAPPVTAPPATSAAPPTIHISSRPSRAFVREGRELVCRTPCELPISADVRRLRISLPQHRPRTITVRPSDREAIAVTLQPRASIISQ